MSRNEHNNESSVAVALIRSLVAARVQFVRYATVDLYGQVRCKAVPMDYLKRHPHKLLQGVELAKVVIGGLPTYGDAIVADAGWTEQGTLRLQPDLSTLRVLPYNHSAIFYGNLYESDGTLSNLCGRSLLQTVLKEYASDCTVRVGAELEFVLHHQNTPDRPVDHSNFADTVLLDRVSVFLEQLHETLAQKLHVPIELLHAESAHGQCELVLEYCNDAVEAMDRLYVAQSAVEAVARVHQLRVLWLPKFHSLQAGNGCHLHLSFHGRQSFCCRKGGGRDDYSLTHAGQSFLEGILAQLPALTALTLPTTNSWRRVGPGCWTGSTVAWGRDDKNYPLRVVADQSRVEYKLCDTSGNLYLSLAGILLAGFAGMERSATLRAEGVTLDQQQWPGSLEAALNELEVSTLFRERLPEELMQSYLAVRRDEAAKTSKLSLEEEVKMALNKA